MCCPWQRDKCMYEDFWRKAAFLVNPKGILKVAFSSLAELPTLMSCPYFVASLQGKAVGLKSVCLWGCWTHTLCVSAVQHGQPRTGMWTRRFSACSAPDKLLQPYTLVSHARWSGSKSVFITVLFCLLESEGKSWDLRMSSFMECWTCWVPSQGQTFHPSGWTKL